MARTGRELRLCWPVSMAICNKSPRQQGGSITSLEMLCRSIGLEIRFQSTTPKLVKSLLPTCSSPFCRAVAMYTQKQLLTWSLKTGWTVMYTHTNLRRCKQLLIPDNFKISVTQNNRYETVLNRSYQELAEYYDKVQLRSTTIFVEKECRRDSVTLQQCMSKM